MKKSKPIGILCMCAGLLLIAAALILALSNLREDRAAESFSEAALEQLQMQITELRKEQSDSGSLPQELVPTENDRGELRIPDMPETEIDGYVYLGIVEIPSLNLSLPVLKYWDYDSLRQAPCRYIGSYYSDDLIIAGHSYSSHFRPLRWVEPESDVYLVNPEGMVIHYRVASVDTLRQEQAEDLGSGEWDLTLFTCTPGGQSRCVVRCFRAAD